MLMKISPAETKLGMFVHGFEGNWLSHPFWLTRFLLTEAGDLERIRDSGVPRVIIDTSKGVGISPDAIGRPLVKARPSPAGEGRSRSLAKIKASLVSPSSADDDGKSLRRQTRRVLNKSIGTTRALFESIALDLTIKSEHVLDVVDDITACIQADHSIIIDMIRLKDKDKYTYIHSIAVCALMINVANELGLDEDQARIYGTAGFLHDIGKSTIDHDVLNQSSALTVSERIEMNRHAQNGHDLLVALGGMPDDVLDVCLNHHERIDGSGYPRGLEGAQLSMPVRLAAICDAYDSLTSDRPYRAAVSPSAAVDYLDGNGQRFDRMLLFSFMKSIGIFPADMLVRLRSNQLGIVLAGAKPKTPTTVRVFWSIGDHAQVEPYDVVPSRDLSGDQIVSRENPKAWGFSDWEAIRERVLRQSTFGKKRH